MVRSILGKVRSKNHPFLKGSYGRMFIGKPLHRTGEFSTIKTRTFGGFISVRDIAIGAYYVQPFKN